MTESNYELIMPFIATKSNGGSFEDGAYVAGWEMGRIDEELKHVNHLSVVIHRENLPQANLVAMRHNCSIEEKEFYLEDETENKEDVIAEWAHVIFDKVVDKR